MNYFVYHFNQICLYYFVVYQKYCLKCFYFQQLFFKENFEMLLSYDSISIIVSYSISIIFFYSIILTSLFAPLVAIFLSIILFYSIILASLLAPLVAIFLFILIELYFLIQHNRHSFLLAPMPVCIFFVFIKPQIFVEEQ